MVDISLLWISQSWKVFDASGFAGNEKSGDRSKDGLRLHGRTAAKSAKTQCPRGMSRPNGPRGGRLLFKTARTINIHGCMYPRELRFLGTNIRGKKRGTITIISSHATRIKGNITALKKKLKECLHKKYNENRDHAHRPEAASPLGISTGNKQVTKGNRMH